MSTRAGIALSRITAGAPFAITPVSGERDQPTYAATTLHNLDGSTPNSIVNTISTIMGNPEDAFFSLALPIGLPDDQKKAIRDVNLYSYDHLTAFVHLNESKITSTEPGTINVLFIDTTPGQVAAKVSFAEIDEGDWFVSPEGSTVLPDTTSVLSPRDVVDKLVTPTIPPSTKIHQIAILRPEGPSQPLSSALESKFPGTPIKWVTLVDLSRGVAVLIHRQPPKGTNMELTSAFVVLMPIGIKLADGRIVTAVQRNLFLPTTRTIALTTSQDNQTTATLQFVNGKQPIGQVVLEGIVRKPKGAVCIQASFEVDPDGNMIITVEELGSTNKKVIELINVLECSRKEVEEYILQEESGNEIQIDYNGQEVGELPA